jgi:hypothetical protein
MRFQIFFALALGALVAAAAGGCNLNPQPLPPGDQSDGGINETVPGAGGSNGETGGGDAGMSGSSGSSGGGTGLTPEAGTTDASNDASGDASADAGPSDASLDAGDAGD